MREIPDTLPWSFRYAFGDQRFGSGNPFSYEGSDMSVEALAFFDHDYELHAFVQVWMFGPDAHWQYGLYWAGGESQHQLRLVQEWGTERPSHTVVGQRIDLYWSTPHYLRFMLR